MTEPTAPTRMTRDHARLLQSYARGTGAARPPAATFLLGVASTLLLTPVGLGLFIAACAALLVAERIGGVAADPLPWAALLAMGAVSVRQASHVRRAPGRSRLRRAGIAADRAAGEVEEERHTIAEARLLRDPDQGGRILLVHTEDDRVFATYDYASFAGPEADAAAPGITARREMRFVRFPQSGI
ncbi:hypothetical protein [Jannaschia seohaensis]|nr:hypothetical protein [Jannaschia seohaensis]